MGRFVRAHTVSLRHKQERRPDREPRRRSEAMIRQLFSNLVRALPGCVLRGFALLTALSAEDTYEAADRVLLPACRFRDLGQRCTLRALHHRDYFCLFVGARLGCALLPTAAP